MKLLASQQLHVHQLVCGKGQGTMLHALHVMHPLQALLCYLAP